MKQLTYAVALAILIATPSANAAEFGFRGVDVRGGITSPSDWDTGYTLGLSMNIGELAEGLFLYPAVSYSVAENSATFFGSRYSLELTSIGLGAEVRYFLQGEPDGWYFGGGPYLTSLEEEAVITVAPGLSGRVAVDASEIEAVGVAGYKHGSLLGEARFSVVSGFRTFQILIGISFD